MRNFCTAAVLAALIPCVCHAAERGRPWIGINVEPVADLPAVEGISATAGVRLSLVQPGAPGAKSGLRTGDIVVAADGIEFRAPADQVLNLFLSQIQKHSAGETMRMTVIRDAVSLKGKSGGKPLNPEDARDPGAFLEKSPPGTIVEVSGAKERRIVVVDVLLGSRTGAELEPQGDIDLLRPDLKGAGSEYRDAVGRIAAEAGILDRFGDLLRRLAACHSSWDGFCLKITAVCHRDPFRAEAAGRDAARRIRAAMAAGPGALPELIRAAAWLSDRDAGSPDFPPLSTGVSPESHMNQVESVLLSARDEAYAAFALLTAEEKNLLLDHRLGISDRFVEHIYLSADEDAERMQRNLALVNAARKVKIDSLCRALLILSRLMDPAYLAGMRGDLLKAFGTDAQKPVLMSRGTEFGEIVFAGTSRNWHNSDSACAVFDLGGDDFYTKGSLAGNSFDRPVGIIVDFEGRDGYSSTTPMSMGSGSLGVAVLCDLKGDDTYTASRWAQGSGFFGAGLLADFEGDDSYRGEELCQAAACFGLGILADFAGNDRYELKRCGQGLGMPGGAGILADAGGNDSYYCKGRYPCSYGTHGMFEGWGQGCAVGFRQWASGGIGVLLDGSGRDRYEAGNFSQGGGYFFGTGILADLGSDPDSYTGSRYDQGFSAHQAIGIFIEEGGDDFYTTNHCVAQGLAWDECVTVFVDDAGNDSYNGGDGFSQGASAHNSFCLFRDRGGKDTYVSSGGQARAGGNDYHGGTSFSLFIDEGGALDDYGAEDRNLAVLGGKEDFAFLDLPSGLAEALRGDSWKALWKSGKKPEERK